MHISRINKPCVFITMGDPSGIGPEIIMKSVASPALKGLAFFVIFADAEVMKKAAGPNFDDKIVVHHASKEIIDLTLAEDAINIVDPSPPLSDVEPGKPIDDGARKALECLEAAVDLMRGFQDNPPVVLVTAPVSKERIAAIKPGFIGHTEYLQESFSAKLVTMVMVGKRLRVVPVTRHIPLKDVAGFLTVDLISETLAQVVNNRVLICGVPDAKIGVCALNPHCGEGGTIGREEGDIIRPAVEKAKKLYDNISGPVSADVMFYDAIKGQVDIVVGMYHDQCLAPFKMVDFEVGVNMTLGLKYLRTSPDHGTAFDIAGKNIAGFESMEQAIRLAIGAIE